MKSILKKIGSSRLIPLTAFCLTIVSLYLYVFLDAGGRWIACDVLYPRAVYWDCAQVIDNNFEIILVSLGLISLVVGIVALLSWSLTQSIKKQMYLCFYKRYLIVLAMCIGIGLIPVQYCLGFLGCSTFFLFPVTVPFAILILIIAILFISVSGNKISFLRIFGVTIVAGTILIAIALSLLEWVDDAATPNRNLNSSAVNRGDVTLCEHAKTTMDRDKCVSSFAVSNRDTTVCQNIIRVGKRDMCEALVLRNTAIDDLNMSMCNDIQVTQQRSVCLQRISERLSRE